MSIPKEPRQLMINIMYLVLTAMLALNVSAKIINAFFVIDKGIKTSNSRLADANNTTVRDMERNAAQNRERYAKVVSTAKEVQAKSKEFIAYVETLREAMVEQTGGYFAEEDHTHGGQPKGYKNKDITTRYLVNQGNGAKLEQKVNATREELIGMLRSMKGTPGLAIKEEELQNLENSIALQISDKDWKKGRGAQNWSEYTFNQLPLAAAFPLMTKFQNDMKSSEAAILNYLSSLIGKSEVKVDQFIPISSPIKSYIIAGEQFESTISVGATSKSFNDNVSIRVNGAALKVENGSAKYTAGSGEPGVKSYKVEIAVKNPTTGEVFSNSETFEYEVGRRSVTVSADKMNVFYMGVENPVTVAAAGVSSNDLRVSFSGNVSRTGGGGNKFTVRGTAPGKATVLVSGGGLKATSFEFRVKPIPDPVAKINNSTGGEIGNGVLKAQGGVIPVLEGFDFDARCDILGYTVIYSPRRQDPLQAVNPGGAFGAQARALINQAKPGDQFIFDNIRAKCPGDAAGRKINNVAFKVQ
ncbi:MAG TPA: gliding motility protein GldM [Haliscomenobacter sp.]|uniref:type IX secretion system motor protein PorM/GldM n=1 Tax=Haliscomenobacter sp. TaxID=2717303 RepID=UPI002B5971A5|nr:gliding motility protein GldM [Haliscomenobacter sp.]HOY18092.1 gliding motility protein GldM [Haliscomenobacter sp.]